MSTHCAHSNLGTFLVASRIISTASCAPHRVRGHLLRYVCEKYQPVLLQPEGGRCGTATARALHDQLFAFLLNHNAATRAFGFHYGYLPHILGRLL
jgi:hypothetical protein